ncbi:TlpA disulfide reductase family protein [Phenylobacterium sp.]|uniref:TlpA family protein disulfide reductase n=1 Tax=Phenylobacterium sp. TaxID=1871053 RepID=UPI0025EA9E05|nr:TlpA disulfide reductase family protein [Phenylobacterium sp.]MBX3482581.1 TlpA family protein disulfide reductase [Phenylobacterium sp.]MCW5759609.1 TlpA family protein disulfide reductase [Phenylobacterium sp.]
MSENPTPETGKPKGGLLTWALGVAALVGVAAVLYIIVQASNNTAPTAPTAPAGKPAVPQPASFASKLSTPETPTPAPDYAFYDEAGKPVKVADLKGKVVVLNVWATWCGPCKIEMPTLAKLARDYEGRGVEVVVVSIDSAEKATQARLFISQNAPLKFYHDRDMKLPFKINAPGFPTTVIYGKDGNEAARVAGDADWSAAEPRAVVEKALSLP